MATPLADPATTTRLLTTRPLHSATELVSITTNHQAARPYRTGHHRGPHAVEGGYASYASRDARAAGSACVVYAICGQLVHLASRPARYDRAELAAAPAPVCWQCAWTTALETGQQALELALMAPGAAAVAAFEAAGTPPLLAVNVCRAILAAEAGADSSYGPNHQATAQLLAQGARHMPMVAARTPGTGPAGHITVICAACSLPAGPWASDHGEALMAEGLVPAPCDSLQVLARRYGLGSQLTTPARVAAAVT